MICLPFTSHARRQSYVLEVTNEEVSILICAVMTIAMISCYSRTNCYCDSLQYSIIIVLSRRCSVICFRQIRHVLSGIGRTSYDLPCKDSAILSRIMIYLRRKASHHFLLQVIFLPRFGSSWLRMQAVLSFWSYTAFVESAAHLLFHLTLHCKLNKHPT